MRIRQWGACFFQKYLRLVTSALLAHLYLGYCLLLVGQLTHGCALWIQRNHILWTVHVHQMLFYWSHELFSPCITWVWQEDEKLSRRYALNQTVNPGKTQSSSVCAQLKKFTCKTFGLKLTFAVAAALKNFSFNSFSSAFNGRFLIDSRVVETCITAWVFVWWERINMIIWILKLSLFLLFGF